MEVQPTDSEGQTVVTGLLPGEPVFVLRARDAVALPLINLYRQMTDGLFDADRDRGLMVTQAEFTAFARRHSTHSGSAQLRFPD
jgi:hypothetical protein